MRMRNGGHSEAAALINDGGTGAFDPERGPETGFIRGRHPTDLNPVVGLGEWQRLAVVEAAHREDLVSEAAECSFGSMRTADEPVE